MISAPRPPASMLVVNPSELGIRRAGGWQFVMMKRREFISLLGGATTASVAWPLAARAQQTDRVRRIGVLIPFAEGDPEVQPRVAAFQQGLQQLGWTEGRNVRSDY